MSAGGAQTTWVDLSQALWDGCQRVSYGCGRCRALEKHDHLPDGCVVRGSIAEWTKVDTAKPCSLVLLCPESDPFIVLPAIGACLPPAEIWWADMYHLILDHPTMIFIALTKRVENSARFYERFGILPNLWLGTSAEDQRTLDERISLLYSIPAAGYLFSLQPLLKPVDLRPQHLDNAKLHLVVAGREMGPGARPCDKTWLDKIEAQCRQRGVSSFITRYTDAAGRAITNPTRSGRGSHRSDRPSYRTTRPKTTIGEMLGLVLCSRCRRVFMPERKGVKTCPTCR